MTDFEWLDSGPNCSEGHYSMHSKIRTQVPPYIPPKFKINPHDFIGLPLLGSVVIEITQIFCGNIKSPTCVVKEALITEVIQPQSSFGQYDDVEDEIDPEERGFKD